MKRRDNLTKIRDIARDVEQGNRNMKALTYCIIALSKEVEELKRGGEKGMKVSLQGAAKI